MIQLSFGFGKRWAVTATLPEGGIDLYHELQRYRDSLIEQALTRSGGNRARAARLLGLKRTTLVMMLKAQAATMRTGAEVSFTGASGTG